MGLTELYQIFKKHPSVCTDTRKITASCLFFALKGDSFNGNTFADTALGQGAAFVIIDDPAVKKDERYILVSDVLEMLQNLARHHRQQLNIPVIGITGTNGKTTTKELLNSVLSQQYETYATAGNLNNHIGVPLTLLSISHDIELAIIEMGANHQKEIEFLCDIAKPTHGLITNVGKAHLEGFGGFEGVKLAKGELYTYLQKNDCTVFINHNNNELMAMSRFAKLNKLVFYGHGSGNFVNGELTATNPTISVQWNKEPGHAAYIAQSNLTGTYNFENILSAICVGSFFKLPPVQINKGIADYKPLNNRSQITKTEHNTLICDYYNANPSSMEVALDNLATIPGGHKVMILGDMFEMGNEAADEHQKIIKKAQAIQAEQRIFIGAEFYKLKNNEDTFYQTTAEAYQALNAKGIMHSTVLIKGSRGMQLEKLVELL
ncbi:MAG: UDP-N-acetylmuramoyl-tripeptide--D-alanyl-D-alanine ligase [Daejeonella sp.]